MARRVATGPDTFQVLDWNTTPEERWRDIPQGELSDEDRLILEGGMPPRGPGPGAVPSGPPAAGAGAAGALQAPAAPSVPYDTSYDPAPMPAGWRPPAPTVYQNQIGVGAGGGRGNAPPGMGQMQPSWRTREPEVRQMPPSQPYVEPGSTPAQYRGNQYMPTPSVLGAADSNQINRGIDLMNANPYQPRPYTDPWQGANVIRDPQQFNDINAGIRMNARGMPNGQGEPYTVPTLQEWSRQPRESYPPAMQNGGFAPTYYDPTTRSWRYSEPTQPIQGQGATDIDNALQWSNSVAPAANMPPITGQNATDIINALQYYYDQFGR